MMTQSRFLLPLLLLLIATPLLAQVSEPTVTIAIVDDPGSSSATTNVVLPALPDTLAIPYPASALTDGIEGKVRLSLSIDETGTVVETRASERRDTEIDPRLLLAAVDVVKAIPFTAGTIDGTAAAMGFDIMISFALPEPTDEYPDFTPNAVPPTYDPAELARNVVYPSKAEREGIQGTVVVVAKLDETGKVVDATVAKSAGELLDAAALKAVTKTAFTPGIQEGKPIKMKLIIPIKFQLAN